MPERDRKDFGFFHFAHVIGFGHHTLVLAAARAGLVPVRKVSPPGCSFRLGASEDPELLAARGLAAATEHFVTDSPYRRYLAYQAGKLFKRPKKRTRHLSGWRVSEDTVRAFRARETYWRQRSTVS